MSDLSERPFSAGRDLRSLLTFVATARRSGDPHAFLHPGGLQWLLRKLPQPTFSVRQWYDGDDLAAVAMTDGPYAMVQGSGDIERHLWLLGQTEILLREKGAPTIETSALDQDSELVDRLVALGFEPAGSFDDELVHEDLASASRPVLPDGFAMRWLDPSLDDAYIELHRAAWSVFKPSPYDRAAHDAVTAMPDFDRRLVQIASAPDGTFAAYCIGWYDPVTQCVEIEPLGTRPEFRRLGLGRAVVYETLRRSAERGAKAVMVWGTHRHDLAGAHELYEACGFRSRRVVREYRRAI